MTVYGYLRVSTAEQARSGYGLDAQRAAISAEAERRGWAVEWVEDNGESGSVPPEARPALGPVLDQLERGDVLVAAKLDRLGRTAFDVLGLAQDAEAAGWSLVVLDLGLDTTTPVGRFSLTMLAAVAELERGLIRQRTREALASAQRRGVRVGRPPETPPEVVARITTARDQGETLQAIADALTADGVPTTRGGARWHPSTVRAVLRSADYGERLDTARQDNPTPREDRP